MVAELGSQVDIFNAHLGVVMDHSKASKSVVAKDKETGQELRLSAEENRFTAPRVISQLPLEKGVLQHMAFPDRKSMNDWIAEQKAQGNDVTPLQKAEERQYFLGEVHHQRKFGGPCGLGAVAYITQTFMAQAFPDLARSSAVKAFLDYTQAIANVAQIKGGCGGVVPAQPDPKLAQAQHDLRIALAAWGGKEPVWWDFDPQPDSTPNAFEFGHRVTVGVDASDGQIFGRFTLFSSINFGMCFGIASTPIVSRTVTIDIDPLAEHPPNDIRRTESSLASARVAWPTEPTAGLAAAISGKTQEAIFANLIRRMEEHSLRKAARKMHAELAVFSSLSSVEGDELLCRVVDKQAQRVWNLANWVISNFKLHLAKETGAVIGPMLDMLIARDPSSPNGLSDTASATLELAKSALIAQMRADIKAGFLDERRIEELLGEGPGAAVVGELVLAPVVQALSR
ncbi:hypothetical protein [Duganella sp. Dugasp56]|uniref:hypothetical protein n=1 Tax=Duganella sp. Dugasp56 TaxID=3243046 RepID=UPI0039AF4ACF